MYKNIEIAPNTYYVGVNDRTKALFENLWPLPNGVSYNSYLIVDEKVALVDSADICFVTLYLDKIKSIIGDRPIDYLIINHMEPDHSGAIRFLRQTYPNIKIIGNNKTIGMVEGFYGLIEGFEEIKDGSQLSLGSRTLTFYMTPMVHWPETMMTYDETHKILFSGDAFGCFGTLDGAVVDSQMNTDRYWDEMYRYYSNIVGKYGSPVQKALQKLSNVEINMICSTHGPIWTEEIPKAVAIYDQLSRYEGKEGVVIAYASMYGNTEQMAETIAMGLSEGGIKTVVLHNVSKSHPSDILKDIFKYNGLIIGSPTYNNELFPEIQALIDRIGMRDVKKRTFGFFGNFSWSSQAVKKLAAFGERMKWEMIETPVDIKHALKEEEYLNCIELGKSMAKRLKEQ